MSAISDTMIISVPHISCIAYSENGFNLTCGLDSGSILNLEPLTLAIIGDIMSYTNEKIECLKFSKDSSFLVFYVCIIHSLERNKDISIDSIITTGCYKYSRSSIFRWYVDFCRKVSFSH